MQGLSKEFYAKDTQIVAKDLIGKKVIRILEFENIIYKLVGLIVETEAYGYVNDPASHAYSGISNRNKIMFGDIGCAYVYLIYGKYFCFNVTAKSQSIKAGAVLIRALYPQRGIKIMIKLRNTANIRELASGPSKLSQALCINKDFNGLDVTQKNNKIWIEDGIKPDAVGCTLRIGISRGKEIPWRFVLLNEFQKKYVSNQFVSKKGNIMNIIKS